MENLYNPLRRLTLRRHNSRDAFRRRHEIEVRKSRKFQGDRRLQAVKRRNENAPKPLPQRRRRALSIPLPPRRFGASKQISNDQSRASFFRLPWEIRQQIYIEVLGQKNPQDLLHIVMLPKRLAAMRCLHQEDNNLDWRHGCWGKPGIDETWQGPSDNRYLKHLDLLPLLKSCRRIYSEATPLLYTHNTFSINHNLTLLHLSRTILPHRFHAIRSLRIDTTIDYRRGKPWFDIPTAFEDNLGTWDRAWSVIAGMQGLRELRVRLHALHFEYWLGEIEAPAVAAILKPLKAVRVEEFEVDLFRNLTEEMRELVGEMPFRLVEDRTGAGWLADKYMRSCNYHHG